VFRERRKRSESIGFGKGDSMPDEKTLPHMKPVVLAKNNPAVIGVFPHSVPPSESNPAGKGWPES
jgi:hypothetical protein